MGKPPKLPLKLMPWLVVTAITWSLGFTYNVVYGGELSWLRRMYWQKIAIAESLKEDRRLIITGGSGAHYAIDSQLIESELGIPVVNLGLDGPIGLDVILPSMIKQVQPGDIVLLIPEYLLLTDSDGFSDRSANFGVAIGQPGLGEVPLKQLIQDTIMLGVPSLRAVAKSAVELVTEGQLSGYYAPPLSDRGDPTDFKPRQEEWWGLSIKRPISKHAVNRILQFRQEVAAKGGTLIISLPWIYGSQDETTLKNVKLTAYYLSKIAPTIYNQETLNIKTNPDLFADTHYHLMPQGREIRAKELIEQLKPIINN